MDIMIIAERIMLFIIVLIALAVGFDMLAYFVSGGGGIRLGL